MQFVNWLHMFLMEDESRLKSFFTTAAMSKTVKMELLSWTEWRGRLQASTAAAFDSRKATVRGETEVPNPLHPISAAFSGSHYPTAVMTSRDTATSIMAENQIVPPQIVTREIARKSFRWLDQNGLL
jgi:hypothetical protein